MKIQVLSVVVVVAAFSATGCRGTFRNWFGHGAPCATCGPAVVPECMGPAPYAANYGMGMPVDGDWGYNGEVMGDVIVGPYGNVVDGVVTSDGMQPRMAPLQPAPAR